jgi:hypothetical protein
MRTTHLSGLYANNHCTRLGCNEAQCRSSCAAAAIRLFCLDLGFFRDNYRLAKRTSNTCSILSRKKAGISRVRAGGAKHPSFILLSKELGGVFLLLPHLLMREDTGGGAESATLRENDRAGLTG